ncbi:MAG: beta-galactosidase, partial [Clostridia bacterium]|nr:beta-galactosidase [Clostridia bacterium]
EINENAPSGKQCDKEASFGCFYTRCTGIWQTVWLEVVPENRITYVKYFPDVANVGVDMEIGTVDEGELEITVLYDGRTVGRAKERIACKKTVRIALSEKHLWEAGNGRLYDVILKFGDDEVHSYFGLREVKFDGMKFLLNGKSVFQRFVLDQGYYQGGVYTPNGEEEFKADIERALKLGFNGIRLHQKVFDPKYLYYCDKLGCMIWGEFPSWGIKYNNLEALGTLTKEWVETIERDFNHPAIVTWCPLNETWKNLEDARKSRDVRFIDATYALTKKIDATRPCVDVSGGFHGNATDLYDFHCYEPYESLKGYIERFEQDDILDVPLLYNDGENNLRYRKGIPVQLSEFGGIKLSDEKTEDPHVETINECAVLTTEDWGYGKAAKSEKEFLERYESLAKLVLNSKKICGFCYTQLYDVEQEQNGFFTYDRKPKLSQETMDRIASCNRLQAEIEK